MFAQMEIAKIDVNRFLLSNKIEKGLDYGRIYIDGGDGDDPC